MECRCIPGLYKQVPLLRGEGSLIRTCLIGETQNGINIEVWRRVQNLRQKNIHRMLISEEIDILLNSSFLTGFSVYFLSFSVVWLIFFYTIVFFTPLCRRHLVQRVGKRRHYLHCSCVPTRQTIPQSSGL